jgi:hypothetical protein
MSKMGDAYNAMHYVRNVIGVRSTNNPADFPGSIGDFNNAEKSRQEKLNLYTAQQTSFLKPATSSSSYKEESSVERVVAAAKTALALRIGNCEAQAALAYCYLVEKTQSSAWLVGLRGYDHSFTVVGPPSNAKALDPSTWGDAIVCDPWANAVYPIADLTAQQKRLFVRTNGGGGIEEGEDQVLLSLLLDSNFSKDKLTEKIIPG